MDESWINRLGATPLMPLLAAIGALNNTTGLEGMIARLHDIEVRVPFALFGSSDNHEPSNVIAHITAGSFGLPDRDYYVRPEPRFQDARTKYQEHIARMFTFVGPHKPL